ncbi:MAG: SPOR domain-containing protein [Motiliproteus sp.]
MLQIASFESAANAQKLESRRHNVGYSAFVLAGGAGYRVIVGYETLRASIDRRLLQLQQAFGLKGIVKPVSALRE